MGRMWKAVVFAMAALLLGGCGFFLTESKQEDGQSERVKVDTFERWSTYDQNSTKEEDRNLMLKKEITF